MPFRSRGFLPHLEHKGSTYFVTFRLAGTLPQNILAAWSYEKEEIVEQAASQGRTLSLYETERLKVLYSKRIEDYLDQGIGECWLQKPEVAEVVASSIRFFNLSRYHLHVSCIMPNHVHAVLTPLDFENERPLTEILHSLKSFTAHRANKILGRTGKFWQEEYYDHLIRSDEEFFHYVSYTLENPVKAGLCKNWDAWKWTECSSEIKKILEE